MNAWVGWSRGVDGGASGAWVAANSLHDSGCVGSEAGVGADGTYGTVGVDDAAGGGTTRGGGVAAGTAATGGGADGTAGAASA